MKKQAIFVLMLVFGISSLAFAQSKTVTNATLEKYRQKRLLAERDLRENYAEMGFPSPEELRRQIQESSRERSELAEKLREERLQMESLKLERERINLDRTNIQQNSGQDDYNPAYSYPNPGFIDYSRYSSSTYYYPGFLGGGIFRGNQRGNYYQNRRGNTFYNRRRTDFYGRDLRTRNNIRNRNRPGGRVFNNQGRFRSGSGSRVVFSFGRTAREN